MQTAVQYLKLQCTYKFHSVLNFIVVKFCINHLSSIFLFLNISSAYKKFKNVDPLSGFHNNKKGRIAFTAVADNVAELKVTNLYS